MPKFHETSIGKVASHLKSTDLFVFTSLFIVGTKENHQKATPRLLTSGEIAMVTSIFKDSINIASVRVRNGPLLLGQGDHAVTPFGEIYFPKEHFKRDFSTGQSGDKHWFMHEMVHVWQFQMGMAVAFWGLGSGAVDYHYELTNDKVLSDYGMEQQASIIADYWCLKTFDYDAWYTPAYEKYKGKDKSRNKQGMRNYWLKSYENTLRLFLKNPKDKKALFG